MSSIEHIILYFLFFLTLFYFCYKSKRGTYQNKQLAETALIIFFILFTIIEGSRYGRGPDWLAYKYRFEYLDLYEPQKGFLGYMLLLKSLGFNYVLYYMTNASLFIIGLFYFIKKTYLLVERRWMLLFAICALMLHAENEIRQYLAFPFLLFALTLLLNDEKVKHWKWILIIILILLCLSIHSGWLFSIPFLFFSYKFIKKTMSPWISIPLLFSAYYIIPSGYFANSLTNMLTVVFDFFGWNDSDFTGASYIENSDRWLGEDSVIEAAMQTELTKFLQFMFECGIITSSYIALKKFPNQKVLFLFNLFLLFSFLDRVMFGYEIFQRLIRQLYIFWFVPFGYAFAKYPLIQGKLGKIMRVAIIISTSYLILYWGRWIFLNPDAKFVWNV